VKRYFKRLSSAFRCALSNALDAGELRPSVDVRKEADFFTSAVLGLFVMLRAEAPAAAIRHASEASLEHLAALCVDGA
jgi:hypothetical protein